LLANLFRVAHSPPVRLGPRVSGEGVLTFANFPRKIVSA